MNLRDVLRNEADFYGASDLIAEALALPVVPSSYAVWTHGWIYYPARFTATYTWNCGADDPCVLTHREEEAAFLRANGISAAFAIGAPFLYAKIPQRKRTPNSLLVMPFHSLDEDSHAPNEAAYLSALDPYFSRFDHVAACIHPSSFRKGFWLENFRARGIPCFSGADPRDRNALRRMKSIFSSFSHVTGDWIGSHLVYAAYAGCSASIFGPTPKFKASDYAEQPFFKQYPEILTDTMRLVESGYVEGKYRSFFRKPDVSSDDRSWAAEQLGEANCRSVEEIARLLGWHVTIGEADLPFERWAPVLGWTPALQSMGRLEHRVAALEKSLTAARLRLQKARANRAAAHEQLAKARKTIEKFSRKLVPSPPSIWRRILRILHLH